MAKQIYQSFDFNGNVINGVAAGVSATDVANKGQVDAAIVTAQAYTDSKIEGLGEYVAQLDPDSGLPTIGSGNGGSIDKGDWWYINDTGTLLGVAVHKGDRLQAAVDNPDTADNSVSNTDFFLLQNFHVADARYEIQSTVMTPDTPVTITHNLGYRFVNVVVVGESGEPVDVNVVYTDVNSLTLTSNTAVIITGMVSI